MCELANAVNSTSVKCVLNFVSKGVIVFPKSAHKERIAENFDVFGFSLTEAEMARIRALDRQQRYENW